MSDPKSKDPTEQQIIIEEKKTKPNGEVTVTKYIKGRFLGKVSQFTPGRFREVL
jgi:hypothetical protein